MTKEQYEKMESHLKKIGFKSSCYICGGKEWEVAGITAAPTLEEDRTLHATETFPVVSVFCKACGYMINFSALKAGVLSE
jgi:hypothetical protein